MTSLIDLCPETPQLCIMRGDTFAWTITIRDPEGNPRTDLAGNQYTLTVNSDPNPADVTNELFAVDGVLLPQSGATLGQVQFQLSDANWTAYFAALGAPSEAAYDLQQTDTGGGIRTVAKGVFEVRQDITK